MCVLRDHFSAIIGQLLNHYPKVYTRGYWLYFYYKIPLFMSNFAKGNNSKNAKDNNRKNKITFFKKSSLGYLLIILYQLFKFVQSSQL